MRKIKEDQIRIETDDRACFLEHTDRGVITRDADGNLLFISSVQDRLVKVTDADGNVVKVFHKSWRSA